MGIYGLNINNNCGILLLLPYYHCFLDYYTVVWSAPIIEYIMARWSYPFHLHYFIIANLRTYLKVLNFSNACVVHSVECMSKIKTLLSIIIDAIYGALCFLLAHFSWDDCENTCTLSYCHHQIGSMNHLSLHRIRPWNNRTRSMSLYVLIIYISWVNLWCF